MQTTTSPQARSSGSRMTHSRERPPTTLVTWTPRRASARTIGRMTAVPTPPPTHTAWPVVMSSVSWPRGPATSVMASPTWRLVSSVVLTPTAWIIRVMVPASASLSAIVSGMRSPPGPVRTMTNWPGRRTFAIRGASTTRRTTFGESCSRSTTGCNGTSLVCVAAGSSPTWSRPRYLPMAPRHGPKVTTGAGRPASRVPVRVPLSARGVLHGWRRTGPPHAPGPVGRGRPGRYVRT